MELKHEHQQTELGVIPADWRISTLASLTDPNRHTRYGIVQPGEYAANGVPMLRSQDYSDGWVDAAMMHRVSPSLVAQYQNARLRVGDLVMTIVGANTGQVVEVPDWLDGAVLSRSTARIAVDKGNADSRFVNFFLQSQPARRQVRDYLKEGAQPVLSCADLSKFRVPLPPTKAEQEAIAVALCDAEAFINSMEQLLTKKRDIKQGALQDLLTGKRRLPGFEKTLDYKKTEVGMIPEDWEIVPIGSLGTFSKGRGVRKDEAASGEIPCVRYGELYTHHNDIIRHFNGKISREVARLSKQLKKGDLLFAGSGETKEEIGKCVAFLGDEEAYAGGDIVILTPKKDAPEFLGYLFNAPVTARQKASRGQGDAVVHITSSALSSIQVPLPPTKTEQEVIAVILDDLDTEIAALEAKLAKARYLKLGMVQELLTGRIRLI